MSILQRVQGHQFRQFIERYDAARIACQAMPPAQVRRIVAQADLVLASHRPRAIHTAELLGAPAILLVDPRFREIEFPVDFPYWIAGRYRFSALAWTAIALALWRLGYGKRCESFAIAQQRARHAADLLESQLLGDPDETASPTAELTASQTRLPKPHSIVLVAHGGINKLISKELRNRGWRGPRLPHSRHWGCTTYCR